MDEDKNAQQKDNKQNQNKAVDGIVDGFIFDAKNCADNKICVSVKNSTQNRESVVNDVGAHCCAGGENNDCIKNRASEKNHDDEKFCASEMNANEMNQSDEKIHADEENHRKKKMHVTQIFREKMCADDVDDDASEFKKKLAAAKRLVWAMGFFMGLGIYLSMVAAFFVYVGMKIDEHFGTHPYGVVSGIFLGFPIAVYGIYYDYKSCGE